jgi:hypothetical protein
VLLLSGNSIGFFNLTNNSIISTFVLTNQDFLPLSDNIFFLLSKEAFTGA